MSTPGPPASCRIGGSLSSIARAKIASSSEGTPIATLIIRNLEPALKETLRIRAAKNGRSMEAELRAIVRLALQGDDTEQYGLGSAIHRRFAPYGGVELEPHPDLPVREPPTFE